MENKIRQLSFRDPGGVVVDFEDRLFRIVFSSSRGDLMDFLESSEGKRLTESRQLVGTTVVPWTALPAGIAFEENSLLVEHERVFFPSRANEWAPQMLWAAAGFTLDLAEKALANGFGLKDATSRNVFFNGTKPVFIDVLSFERRQPGDSTWIAYSQFLRSFVYPLLANKRFGIPLARLNQTSSDEMTARDLYNLCGFFQKFAPTFLTLATLPVLFERKAVSSSSYALKPGGNPEKAAFILKSLFASLRRTLKKCAPAEKASSVWTEYENDPALSAGEFGAKSAWVEKTLREIAPRTVLDVGCNTGHFSMTAAKCGARVVAVDSDEAVVGETWRRANAAALDVLPLVVNFASPTPATGWMNSENASFLDRARGKFDVVMMLGLVHHLAVTERVPLEKIFAAASSLCPKEIIVEFIGKEDPKFQMLLRGRDKLFENWSRESFEEALSASFDVKDKIRLGDSSRWLYRAAKKQ